MEISAKVLREVEFSGSLRGYNTDEVDEFLEQVALAVDALQAELRAVKDRAHQPSELPAQTDSDIDESLRRTLVLAQRTADLAIKEAKDEAALLLDKAREEAESALQDAKARAEKVGTEAERRHREEVIRLTTARDELKGEVETLLSLLQAERERLTESLEAALRYVERSLTPSAEITALPSIGARSPAQNGTEDEAVREQAAESDDQATPLEHDSTAEEQVDDVEAAIAADAAAAAPGAPDLLSGRPLSGEFDLGDDDPWGPPLGDSPSVLDRPTLTALPSFGDYGASERRGGSGPTT